MTAIEPEIVERGVDSATGEIVPLPPVEALEEYADPGVFIEQACGRAKAWLTAALERGDIDTIVETKAQAEAIRCYTAQKNIGKDAELAAAEIVRRAERGIGLCIRAGQDAGVIAKPGDMGGGGAAGASAAESRKSSYDKLGKPSDFATPAELSANGTGIYAMTDGVTDEDFEEAVDEAKAEKNLTRANVVRKAKAKSDTADGKMSDARWARVKRLASEGASSRQLADEYRMRIDGFRTQAKRRGIEFPADEIVGRTRRINSNRVVEQTVLGLEGEAQGLHLINYDDLDPARIEGWVDSLSDSLRILRRLHKNLKEKTQP